MRLVPIILYMISILPARAQDKSPFSRFGSITLDDLKKTAYPIDSSASAIVLSDIGRVGIDGNSKGWFSVSLKRHRVVHILKKNGYHEAEIEIPLYSRDGAEEKLKNIRAITYNAENGRIRETKLDRRSVYQEKVNKNLLISRFTMPGVKEGSIIEIEYEVISDFIDNLDPWYFQGSSPVLWSQFELSLPQFFSYGFIRYGYEPFYISDRKDRGGSFLVVDENTALSSKKYSFNASISDYRWVMKDVPELKEENFTSTLKNHIARIEFQLASYNPPLSPRSFRTTWPMLTASLMESEYFGNASAGNNGWLEDEVKLITKGATDSVDKAKKIFSFIRDQFTCTNHSALWRNQTLKNVARSRSGTVSEINLLLTALLKTAGLTAEPVILSTRSHGYVPEDYPMITSFNYVICRFKQGSNTYFLDATYPKLGFGKLMPDCWNGHARVVNEEADAVNFEADSIVEKKLTTVFISTNNEGGWKARVKQQPGYVESYSLRAELGSSGERIFFSDLQKQYGDEAKIEGPRIDQLHNYDVPVSIEYEIAMAPASGKMLYINPMFGEGYKTNPFVSAERNYPVEMPYAIDETFILTMDIPVGYMVDEIPKQLVARLDEQGQSFFEYLITVSGQTISLRSRIKMSRTVFMPEEYESLRKFFDLVVNKQNEQLVFRKNEN